MFNKLTFEELGKYSKIYSQTSYFTKYKNVCDIFYILDKGNDIGLPPARSIETISYNAAAGKFVMMTDSMVSLALTHPSCEFINEYIEGEGDERAAVCVIKRKGWPERVYKFSVKDAIVAGLWGKPRTPWTLYPERMLAYRAKGFALRDVFGDIFCGIVSNEEVEDYPIEALNKNIKQKVLVESNVDKKTTLDKNVENLLPDVNLGNVDSAAVIEEVKNPEAPINIEVVEEKLDYENVKLEILRILEDLTEESWLQALEKYKTENKIRINLYKKHFSNEFNELLTIINRKKGLENEE